LETVRAVRDLGAVDTGGSKARFVYCDDGKEYVVKFVEGGRKTPINELVGGKLALTIDLPSPNIVKVEITESFLNLFSELRTRIQAGLHIGIERLSSDTWSFNYPIEDRLRDKTLINAKQLYGVICFDNWTYNDDRDNKGNNMIEFLSDNKMKYIMIDFGHCFTDHVWDENILRNKRDSMYIMRVFDFIKRRVADFKFEDWFTIIENFPDITIDSIVDEIPKSWNLSANEKNALLEFIKNRKHLIRKIINNNRGMVESWRLA